MPIDLSNPHADTSQMFQQMPEKRRGGMFGGGGKFGLKEAIAFGLAGFMSRRNPAIIQGLMGMMGQRQQDEREDHQYERHMADQKNLWMEQQQWKLQHPDAPDIVQRIQALDGIQPGLGKTYAQNYAQNGGGLGTIFKDPATGQQYMPQQMPPLGVEMDDPRKAGGAGQSGPLTFR